MSTFIDQYHSQKDGAICFSREQGSRFAKQVADDFNPLHDTDNKLFCIPGDLLFSMALTMYALSKKMRINYTVMVGSEKPLILPDDQAESLAIVDADNKQYLTIERSGQAIHEPELIEKFARSYVAFSGHNFPDLLIPLMTEKQVMINPTRPIAIYDSMAIELNDIDQLTAPRLEYTRGSLEVNGKKGDVRLEFSIKSADLIVGQGTKYMSLRGLKPFDQKQIDQLVANYNIHKAEYTSR